MKKTAFRNLCNRHGHNNPVNIEEALIVLLESQKGKMISVPEQDGGRTGLVEYLTGRESISVIRTDRNNSESYISALRLDREGQISINVYDYYEASFRVISIRNLEDSRDAMRFALEFAVFDEENVTKNAGNLTDKQLEALDEFLAAAERLNNEGVSLIWDEEGNNLCAANRDAMRDHSFFRVEPDGEVPEGALLLSETATNSLDIEMSYMSNDYDLYYFLAAEDEKA